MAPDQTSPKDPSLEVNFALVLSRMTDLVQQDAVELRAGVYELARIKSNEQIREGEGGDIGRLVLALETAIDGVKAFAKQQEQPSAIKNFPSGRAWPSVPGSKASSYRFDWPWLAMSVRPHPSYQVVCRREKAPRQSLRDRPQASYDPVRSHPWRA